MEIQGIIEKESRRGIATVDRCCQIGLGSHAKPHLQMLVDVPFGHESLPSIDPIAQLGSVERKACGMMMVGEHGRKVCNLHGRFRLQIKKEVFVFAVGFELLVPSYA